MGLELLNVTAQMLRYKANHANYLVNTPKLSRHFSILPPPLTPQKRPKSHLFNFCCRSLKIVISLTSLLNLHCLISSLLNLQYKIIFLH